jgi:hypothetical protein
MLNEAIDKTTDPKKKTDQMRRALYSALFIPPPHGFRLAIDLANKLIKEGSADATIHLWLAAALGQKFEWLKQNAGKQEEIEQAKQDALAAVKKVVELVPEYSSMERKLLRSMFDPDKEGTPREDGDDLEVFKDMPEFREEVYRGAPA